MPHIPPRLGRRAFLRLSLGATALLAGCAGSAPGPAARARAPGEAAEGFIDAHVHFWSADQTHYPHVEKYALQDLQPVRYEPEDFLRLARGRAIERAVVIQPGCYGTDHRYLRGVLDAHPGRFAGVGSLEGARDPVALLRRLASEGFRGVRVVTHRASANWPHDEGARALWRAAAAADVPLCILAEAAYLPALEATCARAPETPVVVDHLGRPRPGRRDREADVAALCALARHPRVKVKVSGLHFLGPAEHHYAELLPAIYRVVDAFGPERVMWGSDAPHQLLHGGYADALALLRERADRLSASDRDWILRGTAERTFFSA
jgi:predicted TIM-barrel fold metal-dependent hydrolase